MTSAAAVSGALLWPRGREREGEFREKSFKNRQGSEGSKGACREAISIDWRSVKFQEGEGEPTG